MKFKKVIPVLAFMLAGCSGMNRTSVQENVVLTVSIENRSEAALCSVAVSYSLNDTVLGSKACQSADGSAETEETYDFVFLAEELPEGPLSEFRVDVYAAENAGEDYSACGSAVIETPQAGSIYRLVLNGSDAAALYITAEDETKVRIIAEE